MATRKTKKTKKKVVNRQVIPGLKSRHNTRNMKGRDTLNAMFSNFSRTHDET